MVLVQLSVVEQRLDAVRAVLAGATATEVGGRGRGIAPVCAYLDRRYLVDGLAGTRRSYAGRTSDSLHASRSYLVILLV